MLNKFFYSVRRSIPRILSIFLASYIVLGPVLSLSASPIFAEEETIETVEIVDETPVEEETIPPLEEPVVEELPIETELETVPPEENNNPVTTETKCSHECPVEESTGRLIVKKTTLPEDNHAVFRIQAWGTGKVFGGGKGTVSDDSNWKYEVEPGTYSVSEKAKKGWQEVGNTCKDIYIEAGETKHCRITNMKLGEISGYKFRDLDGDIETKRDRIGVEGWKVKLWKKAHDDSFEYIGQVITDKNGFYQFEDLMPGEYKVKEIEQSGWVKLSPDGPFIMVDLKPGENECNNDFVNVKYGQIKVFKDVQSPEGGDVLDKSHLFEIQLNWNDARNITDGDSTVYDSLEPGIYTVSETNIPDGYILYGSSLDEDPSLPGFQVDISLGEEIDLTVINRQKRSKLVIYKDVVDSGGGDIYDSQEFKVRIHQGGDNVTGWKTISDDEFESQYATFHLNPGTYKVREQYLSGYEQINCKQFGPTETVKLLPGETYEVVCQNMETEFIPETGSLTVIKDVLNPDGSPVVDNATTFNIALDGEDVRSLGDGQSTQYLELPAGTYTVTEEVTLGYTFDSFSVDEDPDVDGAQITVTGEGAELTIFNRQQKGKIIVYKDVINSGSENAVYSEDVFEIVMNAEGMVDNKKDISDSQFSPLVAEYSDLYPGTYTFTESPFEGYEFLGCRAVNSEDTLDDLVVVNVASGTTYEFVCVNQFTEASLQLEKSNNTGGADLLPGSSVVYTLVVTAPENSGEVKDVEVVDLAPEGFNYVSGSWAAISSERGDLRAQLITGEPTYASPGGWKIGDMKPGEVVTLTYMAVISSLQDAGVYKDLAWVEGQSVGGERVVGSAPLGVFAGTEVSVITPPPQESVKAEVLGVTLPNTGANMVGTALSGIMILLGLTILLITGKNTRKLLPVTLGLVLFTGLIGNEFVQSAYAESTNYIRLESPKSPTGKADTKIGFVALDIDNNALTVTCYVKKPGGTYTAFDTIGLVSGGNNGNCQLNASILNQEGIYEFYATANGAVSEVVAMEFDAKGPLPIVDYKRTRNNCSYTLDFSTGSDSGQTVLVQIFRSDKTSFTANQSTLVKEIFIGSGKPVTYIDTVPDCNKDFFYAVRAVDDAGNTSDFVTDRLVEVTSLPPVDNGDGGDTEGEVAGEETDGNNGEENEGGNGEVKGEDNDNEGGNGNGSKNEDGEGTGNGGDEKGNVWDWLKWVIAAVAVLTAGTLVYLYVNGRDIRIKLPGKKD
ncbi:MAG: Peptidase S8 and S53, subtilisin, kexin, sedolisin [candidate division WS6 bacterium GW2011_GWF2_39_15]|uniref:Peptidase S8 and S53, subtilisin, kexin, sedolisin n=1 Tax=candidate division WS6 bacterium GW2011_GWF2_39_15 TaxID=1619100 RepID=A0A0G0Q5P6_9BACT|nr:MAG: Peptidase S8 and S53, subtilisin, kexin, sedolisin [candidate division WS6 bacterium GW2011_GWF2_39_15]